MFQAPSSTWPHCIPDGLREDPPAEPPPLNVQAERQGVWRPAEPMKPLGIWTRCRLCCRGQDWGLRCCLAHKLPREFPQRLHPACSLLQCLGSTGISPWAPSLCPARCLPGQPPQQESLCLCLVCWPQALPPCGSQPRLQNP